MDLDNVAKLRTGDRVLTSYPNMHFPKREASVVSVKFMARSQSGCLVCVNIDGDLVDLDPHWLYSDDLEVKTGISPVTTKVFEGSFYREKGETDLVGVPGLVYRVVAIADDFLQMENRLHRSVIFEIANDVQNIKWSLPVDKFKERFEEMP